MRIYSAFCAVLLFVAGSANATGESIRIQPPSAWGGWKEAANQRGANVALVAWIPKDQSASSWKEAINLFTYASVPPGDAVAFLIQDSARQFAAGCAGGSVVPPKIRREKGISIGFAQFYCPKRRDSGLGRVDFLKVIATDEKAFVVMALRNTSPYQMPVAGSLVFSNPVEGSAVTEWLKNTGDYLSSQVSACKTLGAGPEICVR